MTTYILVDSLNTFFRSRHAISKRADSWGKVGFALHSTLASVNSVVRQFGDVHVVFCVEGRSWRKAVYGPYKANRAAAAAARTVREVEEDELFIDVYNQLIQFLTEKTNCSVIGCEVAEADDVIARFIALHEGSNHVIVSSDTDYLQLISPSVRVFNGVDDKLYAADGITTITGKPWLNKKTKEPLPIPDPEWILFEKCIRGDTSDNIFSAYPGVRSKGTKNKVGLLDAFADREKKGYAWNNIMLSKWVDHNDIEHRVLDDYLRNVGLVDLTAQPDDIKAQVDQAIRQQVRRESVGNAGVFFLKFCGKFELIKLSDMVNQYATWLSRRYTGEL